jgi:hypothetical protein
LEHPFPDRPSLKQFHLSSCRARADEFRDYSLGEIDRITYLFRRVILDTGLITLAAAVNRVAWNELVTPDIAPQLPSPEEVCFSKCVESVINAIRYRKPGQKLVMFFDQGTRSRIETWATLYLAQTEKYPEIAGISFAKVSDVVALQGADMIATETYQYAQACMKDRETPEVNPHFRDYIKRDLSGGAFFDRAHIEEVVARMRQSLKRPI